MILHKPITIKVWVSSFWVSSNHDKMLPTTLLYSQRLNEYFAVNYYYSAVNNNHHALDPYIS